MKVGRRSFVRGSALGWLATGSKARASARKRPLVADKAGVLDLPEGFRYRILQRAGEPMSDGYRVPGRPDAMGCFRGRDGALVLMRNHEIPPGSFGMGPYRKGQTPPPEAYDEAAGGGVTRLVIDPQSGAVKRSNLVLCGTCWNCAGGPSPFGWLSCEETDVAGHGYVFLCDPERERVAPPRRIPSYGRMRHEAASVDPRTHIAYLTEDRPDSSFYRFVPTDESEPFEGQLQALRIKGKERFDLGRLTPGVRLPIDWVPIDDPDSDSDEVRVEAQRKGAALVRRGEGLWLDGPQVYLCATAGGPIGLGQVLRVSTGPQEFIEVIAHSTDPDELDMPDNLTVSPEGHVYLAEDGFGGNYLRRLRPDGGIVDFARNAVSTSEFAGPCFSPDGRTLFVNIQSDGLTLAIEGPFDREHEVDAALSTAAPPPDGEFRAGRGIVSGLSIIALAALMRRKRRAQASQAGSEL